MSAQSPPHTDDNEARPHEDDDSSRPNEENEPQNEKYLDQEPGQDGRKENNQQHLGGEAQHAEEHRGGSRSPSPHRTSSQSPGPANNDDSQQGSNDDSQKSHKTYDDKKSYSSGSHTRRSYDNRPRGPYPRTDVRDTRPYRGYQGGHYTRDDFQRRGPIINDHRNFEARRGEYNPNYPPGAGRGSYKRNYDNFAPNDPAPKRIRRSPENFRGGYEPRGGGPPSFHGRPPFRRNSPPPPPQRFEGYHYQQPPAPRFNDLPPRQYDDRSRRPYEDVPAYDRPRDVPPYNQTRGPGTSVYDNRGHGYERGGRGSYNGAPRYERRPMINEERSIAAGFEYNRGGAYPPRSGATEERYNRDAPVVIDRRNPERYNQQPPYNSSFDSRRRGSYEDRQRNGSGQYYDQPGSAYTDQQNTVPTTATTTSTYRDASYPRSGGYSSGGYNDTASSSSSAASSSSYSYGYSETKQTQSSTGTNLPPNWREYQTKEGKKYYHNSVDGTTQWELPTESNK